MRYDPNQHVVVKAYPDNHGAAEQVAAAVRTGHLWVGQKTFPDVPVLYLIFGKSPVSLGDEEEIIKSYLDEETAQHGS